MLLLAKCVGEVVRGREMKTVSRMSEVREKVIEVFAVCVVVLMMVGVLMLCYIMVVIVVMMRNNAMPKQNCIGNSHHQYGCVFFQHRGKVNEIYQKTFGSKFNSKERFCHEAE